MKRLIAATILGALAGAFFCAPLAYAHPADPVPHAVTDRPLAGHLKASSPPPTVVAVRAGDTLTAIAAAHRTTWAAIAAFNHMADPNLIFIGQRLTMPPAGYVTPREYSAVAAPHRGTIPRSGYTVTGSYTPSYTVTSRAGCYGLTDPNALYIISVESRCQTSAANGQYCGIGQLSGYNCQGGNGYAQADAMTAYVMGRYGSWAAAAAHERAFGWY